MLLLCGEFTSWTTFILFSNLFCSFIDSSSGILEQDVDPNLLLRCESETDLFTNKNFPDKIIKHRGLQHFFKRNYNFLNVISYYSIVYSNFHTVLIEIIET